MTKPRIIILAGPNGAGKSTVAKYLLTEKYFIDEFVNADAIASGLSAFAPENVAFEAGRIMLRRIETLLKERRNFAFETTLASKSFTRLIARAQSSGYRITLLYVALPSAQLAKRRVAKRVKEGGHSMQDATIERCFYRSLDNLMQRYRQVVNEWFVYDNAALKTPTFVAHGRGAIDNIVEEQKWQRLQKLAKTGKK